MKTLQCQSIFKRPGKIKAANYKAFLGFKFQRIQSIVCLLQFANLSFQSGVRCNFKIQDFRALPHKENEYPINVK